MSHHLAGPKHCDFKALALFPCRIIGISLVDKWTYSAMQSQAYWQQVSTLAKNPASQWISGGKKYSLHCVQERQR